jgi:hypothetical protein
MGETLGEVLFLVGAVGLPVSVVLGLLSAVTRALRQRHA